MDTPAEERPIAWQPLTPAGVAAFAHAPLGRLLLVQLVLAVVVAGAVLWFLHAAWFPVIAEAIERLPAQGEIRSGVLNWRGESPVRLAENRFLSVAVDLRHEASVRSPAHVQVEFGRADVRVLSLPGYWQLKYPRLFVIAFNRPELWPWWGARSHVVLGVVGMFVIAGLFVVWAVLATAYCGLVSLAGFFGNRDLPLAASWRLAGAALMPGALFMAIALVLYAFGVFDPLRLAMACAVHFVIGWLYILVAPFEAPYLPGCAPPKKNPFGPRTSEPEPPQAKAQKNEKPPR